MGHRYFDKLLGYPSLIGVILMHDQCVEMQPKDNELIGQYEERIKELTIQRHKVW